MPPTVPSTAPRPTPTPPDPPAPQAGLSERLDEVSRAFGDPTRRAIYFEVVDSGSTTVAHIADRFGVHPNVARHHLERLLVDGYLEVAAPEAHSRRGAGRPSKRYVPSAKEVGLGVETAHDEHLLVELLLATLTTLEPADASRLAEQAGAEYGRRLASSSLTPDQQCESHDQLLASVAASLSDHGFAATANPGNDEIVSEACPFGEIAQRFPHVVCALDHGMVRGMVEHLSGTPVEIRQGRSRAQGDAACATSF